MIGNMDSSEKECLLYLPNYNELTSLRVGGGRGGDDHADGESLPA